MGHDDLEERLEAVAAIDPAIAAALADFIQSPEDGDKSYSLDGLLGDYGPDAEDKDRQTLIASIAHMIGHTKPGLESALRKLQGYFQALDEAPKGAQEERSRQQTDARNEIVLALQEAQQNRNEELSGNGTRFRAVLDEALARPGLDYRKSVIKLRLEP